MIIDWSEYVTGGLPENARCALHGESPHGHRFHICSTEIATHAAPEWYELWGETGHGLEYLGHFASETAAKIQAERVAAAD